MDFTCKKSEKSGNIVLGPVRLVFENLNEPKQNDQGKDVWGGCFLLPKGADAAVLKAALGAAAKEKWGDKIPNFKHGSPLKDQGDMLNKEGDPYDFCEAGALYFNANSYREVKVYDGQRLQVTGKENVYSGMWVIVAVNPYAYEAKGNKGVSIGLQQIQKVKDGDRLGGGFAKAEDDFEDIKVEGGDPDNIFG